MKLLLLITGSLLFNTSFAQINNRDVKNPKNPYDNVGQKHNDGLSLLAKKIESEKINSFVQVVDTYTKTNSEFKQIGEKLKASSTPLVFRFNNFSKDGQAAVTSFIECIDRAGTTGDLYACFKKNEDFVLSNKNIPESEKVPILIAAAVGRYSSQYWTDETSAARIKINWKRVKEVVLKDFEGAGAGATLGSVLPGVGTTAGAVGGAVIASACAGAGIVAAGGNGSNNPGGKSLRGASIEEKKDFVWSDPMLMKILGYESITFKKGIYKISNEGTVTLNIIATGKPLFSPSENLIRVPNSGTKQYRGFDCFLFGFSCCVYDKVPSKDNEPVDYQFVLKDGKAVALTILFRGSGSPKSPGF